MNQTKQPSNNAVATDKLPYQLSAKHEPGRPPPPMLTVVSGANTWCYPLATLHRIRCNETDEELVISFVADVVKIRGRGLDTLRQELVEGKVVRIWQQSEAEAGNSTAAVTVFAIEVTKHSQFD